ncbi:MAG TPA: hypothetical protein VHG28_01610, partial [Longimicrobiaceae bacterium]|nr:hypothetical protein [Longimicrobiaceae bacterium]
PPAPDPQAAADRLIRATTPASPQQVNFSWELDEAGARLRGRGVVRLHAPDRLRLDLFGPRGETYLAAALVGDSFRIPPAVAGRFALPSPALLWGALGVVRPPTGATLQGATASGEGTSLRYETRQGETVEFGATAERLRTVRRDARSSARESIALTYSDAGQLRRAEYRDWGAYRTLILNIETINHVESFPEDTWLQGSASR